MVTIKLEISIPCRCDDSAPPRPHRVIVAAVREITVATFGIKFGLPAVGASDVAKRELTVTVNGGDPPAVTTMNGQPLLSDEMVFNVNDVLSVTLVDIDGAGNRSQPSAALAYTVTDTVPPPQPGVLSVGEVRQID